MKLYQKIVLLICCLTSLSLAQTQYQLIDLGTLGGNTSVAYSISDSGQVVGDSRNSDGEARAFLWQDGNMISLGTLGGSSSTANDINDFGQIVGYSLLANGQRRAFLWHNGTMTNLGTLGGFKSWAWGINNSGQIVGQADTVPSSTQARARASLWDGGIMSLGFPGDAYSINNSGHIVGFYLNELNMVRGFLWEGGGLIDIGAFENNETIAWDINNIGQVVGESNNFAFLWENGNMLKITIQDQSSCAYDINDSGQIVGDIYINNELKAFIWENGSITNLNDLIDSTLGWNLITAYSINNSGQIVGLGHNGVQTRAFLLNPENNTVPWLNQGGGSFSQGSNWLGGNPPDNEQIALFDTSYFETSNLSLGDNPQQTITVTFDDVTTTQGLTIQSAEILFDLQSHSYGVENLSFSGPLVNSSLLEINNGVLGTTNKIGIGENGLFGQITVGSNATLEVTPLSQLPNSLVVGSGDCGGECGKLIIQNGGKVFTNSSFLSGSVIGTNSSTGSVYITGDGSEWADSTTVIVGENAGTGLIEITNGASFLGNNLWLAFLDDSHGEVTVDGTGSSTVSSIYLLKRMYVGLASNNTEAHFKISNGATAVLEKGIEIGSGSGNNDVTVTGFSSSGDPSTLTITDTTFIGTTGSGGMNVLNWGDLLTSTTVIPGRQGGIGSVLIDGEGSEWRNAGTIRLGFDGVGFINITNQGVLYTAKLQTGSLGSVTGNNIYIGNLPSDSQRKKKLNDKSEETHLVANASIYVDTLLLSEDAELIADSVYFEEGGYLGGEGSFSFDVTNSGGINPGDSINTPGTFTINANYTQLSTGNLYIELGGDSTGIGFDRLNVLGNAQLAGTLDISVLGDYEPQVGQTFEILTANNITGTFENIITHRGLGVDVTYNSNNIIITITSPVSVNENDNTKVPTEYSLKQNYPNPFNPITMIQFSIPEQSNVTLKVYDVLGNEVATLVDEYKPAGSFEIKFDASNLASGIYFYKIEAGTFNQINKMILLR